MGARPRANGLRTNLIFAAVAAVLWAVATACSGHPVETTPTIGASTPSVARATVDPGKAQTVISAFSANEFFSISAAEAAAGFHIPVPSEYYPLGFGRTYLRRAQDGSGTFSTTQYTFPPLPSHSIGVDAGPSSVFNTEGFKRKEPRTIGAKRGWLLRNDGKAIQFAYQYGDADGVTLWAVVQAPAEVGLDAFQQFVQSLQ
jgi:hypothetical protein